MSKGIDIPPAASNNRINTAVTQLKLTEPQPGVMCLELGDGLAVTHRGKGNDAGAALTCWPAPTRRRPRLMTGVAGCELSTVDIGGQVQVVVHDTGQAPPFSLSPAIP